MSAHPFGKPRHQLGRPVPALSPMGRLWALCAIATILSIGAIVLGIDVGQLGGGR